MILHKGKLGWQGGSGCKTEFEVRNIFDLFEIIERRPGLFLGKKTITGLYYFYNGYTTAMSAYEISFDGETTVFAELVEYIKTALKIKNSEKGWPGLILEECEQNEEKAFDLFFILLKEFKASLPQSANVGESSNNNSGN